LIEKQRIILDRLLHLCLSCKLAAEAEAQVTDEGLSDEQLKIYSTIGGTPHLDGQYTVFGEVEKGLDVVEMIQSTATGRADRPIDDIEMRMLLVE
jgi:peptidyl-prolyl cis-trans isomerase B (cyclophilin B)